MNTAQERPSFGWVFIFFISIYILSAGGHYYSADGVTIYLVTRSIVEQGTIFITETDALSQLSLVAGKGQEMVPISLPVHSLLMIPLYLFSTIIARFLDGHFLHYALQLVTSFFNSFITAGTATFLYLMIFRMGYGKRIAIFTSFTFAFATLAWPYAKFDFSEPLLAFFIFGAVYWSYMFRIAGRDRYALLAGAFLGLAEGTKVVAAISIAPVIIYFLFIIFEKTKKVSSRISVIRPFVLFSGGLMTFFSILPLYNFLRFGTLVQTGYGEVVMNNPLLLGLFGLLLSTGKGLIFYSPAILLSLFGFRAFTRRHKAESYLIVSVTLIALIFYSKLYVWHGDVAWGPRYLVYLLPLAMVPAAEIFRSYKDKSRRFKVFVVSIVSISFFIQLIAISVFYNTFLNYVMISFPDDFSGAHLFEQLSGFWFTPKYSPIIGELSIFPGRVIYWINAMLQRIDYAGVPSDTSKLFPWFGMPVPDFWWVYYSMAGAPRKILFALLIPVSAIFISAKKILKEIRS